MQAELRFDWRWAIGQLGLFRGRTLRTVLGLAIAVALLVGVVSFYRGYEASLRRGIDQLGFEVLVTAPGCPYEAATMLLRGGRIPMYLDESIAEAIAAHPDVERHARLFLQAVPAEKERTLLVLGVDERYVEMKPWLELTTGTWLGAGERAEAVLGFNAASELETSAGGTISLPGWPDAIDVAGTLARTGTQDDGTVFLPLRFAQRVFGRKDRLTGIGLKVRDTDRLAELLESLHELPSVQVVVLSHAQTVILSFAGTLRRLLGAVGVLAALVAALLLLNTLSMSLLERRRELALLRALGARGVFLFRILLFETAFVSLLGGVLGIALAFVGARLVDRTLRRTLPFTPEGPLFEIGATTVLAACLLAVVGGLLCAAIPAWKASRVAPFRSLREGV